MKKTLLILIALCIVLPAFGLELTYLSSGQTIYVDKPGPIDTDIIATFEKTHPGVTVRPILVDLSTGSTMTADALIASGQAPDVYSDFGGRSGRFVIPEYALDLTPYLSRAERDDYIPSLLALTTKGGKILALPLSMWAHGFAVNTDILASAGYTLPTSWTTTDFLAMAEKVKAKGKYATILFAKNQSSDAWWMDWFAAFGAVQFANADYSKTRLNSPQGIAALNFLKLLVDKGYVPPGPPELDDDIALEQWARGNIVGLEMQSGHAPPSIKSAVDQKLLDKPFAYTFMELPHAPGLAHTPTTAGPTLIVVHKSNDQARNRAAVDLAKAFGGGDFLKEAAKRPGYFPALRSVPNTADDPMGKLIQSIVGTAGVWDMGIVLPQFSEIRAQGFPLMQEFYAGRLTAQQVLNAYEAKVNVILGK